MLSLLLYIHISVYGWLNDTYIGEEKFQEHVIRTGFRKGAGEYINYQEDMLFDVISIGGEGLEGEELHTYKNCHDVDTYLGAEKAVDFELLTETTSLNNFVLVKFLEDLIALEHNETFFLKLRPKHTVLSLSGLKVLFCDSLKLTIIDSDGE